MIACILHLISFVLGGHWPWVNLFDRIQPAALAQQIQRGNATSMLIKPFSNVQILVSTCNVAVCVLDRYRQYNSDCCFGNDYLCASTSCHLMRFFPVQRMARRENQSARFLFYYEIIFYQVKFIHYLFGFAGTHTRAHAWFI